MAVGFGNALCIYASETLKLKCVLSAPNGIDGSGNKLTVRLPPKENSGSSEASRKRTAFLEKRKELATCVKNLLEGKDSSIIKRISSEHVETTSKAKLSKRKRVLKNDIQDLSHEERQLLFSRIMAMNTINLFQKISILDRFNLNFTAPLTKEEKLKKYANLNRCQPKVDKLIAQSALLDHRKKYSSCRKMHQFKLRQKPVIDTNRAVERLIRFTIDRTNTKTSGLTNGNGIKVEATNKPDETKDESTEVPPVKCAAQIKHVAFCAGEFSHLVIACTENRILIWNLLTLRLKSTLKLSVNQISVDVYTSLVSVFTDTNELIVFLPNTPLPLYQNSDLPKILGAAWIPRRHPKPHSLTVDWQALTELFMLSEKQVRSIVD